MKKQLLLLSFLSLLCTGIFAQTSVGIIGTATPGGWDADTDLVQDMDNPDLWTLSVTLFNGEAKFRADDDWAVNWGSTDFPTGTGEQDGSNIPVFAGDYDITFNSATGEYHFAVRSDVGLIGDATPGGWDADTDMFFDTLPNKYFLPVTLGMGECKFRQDDEWTVNWGAADFPMGVGMQDGPNIPIEMAGDYMVRFDKSTGEYSFEQLITYESIGLIGDATPGGWDTDTDMIQNAANPDEWSISLTLGDGGAKFRANDMWTFNWGGTDFPSGTAVEAGDNIPVTAGDYLVKFNTETLEYSFTEIVEYSTVGIIGDATPGGWDADTDMEKDAEDGSMWSLRVILGDGEAKFRAEDEWTVNWGAGDFPMGVATQDGANIPITAGEYIITFNSVTGEYNFEEIVVFNTVGLIGPAIEGNAWDVDVDLTQDGSNEHLWALAEIDLIDGEAKFRAEDEWTVNWGAVDFPVGVGVQDGPNIIISEGTYGITINTLTGDYLFGEPLSAGEVLDPASIKVFPNPTSNLLQVELEAVEIKGDAQFTIFDMTGKVLQQVELNTNGTIRLDVSQLQTGNYLLHISNEDYIIGKRFSVVK